MFKSIITWIFLFSWVPVYTDKDKRLAVMSIGFSLNDGLGVMPLCGKDLKKMVFFSDLYVRYLYNYFLSYLDLFKLVNQSYMYI